MPVFNGAPVVEAAIKSLLNQSFTDFELIIGDNCSTDGTSNIVQNFSSRDKRIKYFRHEKNQGGLFNFEFVKDHALGQYFMWAAHDDMWDVNYLQSAIKVLNEESNIGFVFPSFKLASIKLGFKKRMNSQYFKFIESDNSDARVLSYVNLHHSVHKCNLVYSLFRREQFEEVYKKQNLENDGLLSTLLLSHFKGHVLGGYLFQKRYNYYWPGLLISLIYFIKRTCNLDTGQAAFDQISAMSTMQLVNMFPHLQKDFEEIQANYSLEKCLSDYRIIRRNYEP